MITKDAAKYLGISPYYLRNMRQGMHVHEGPKCTQIKLPNGYGWDYTLEDLNAWKASHSFRRDIVKKPRVYKKKKQDINEDFIYI